MKCYREFFHLDKHQLKTIVEHYNHYRIRKLVIRDLRTKKYAYLILTIDFNVTPKVGAIGHEDTNTIKKDVST